MNYSISVIVPNYNGEEILKENLPKVFNSLSLYKNGKIEVIISDDYSIDNSIKVLENLEIKMRFLYPAIKFKIIKNNKNLGFASNINQAVNSASGDILILLNTDVFPKDDFLSPLLKHFVNPNTFAVGCMDESLENGKIVLRGRGIGLWKRGFLIHSRGEVDKTNTLWVNGGSGAFRKNIWEKLGGFDRIYNPFYWEDIDLSYRALKSGYDIFFESKSVVIHEHEKGIIKRKFSQYKIKSIAYRNQFIFMWKNLTDIDLRFLHLFWLPYFLIKALVRGDFVFFVGFFFAILQLPQVIKERNNVQKYFIKSDREIIKNFT